MIFSALYLLTCHLLGGLLVLARHEVFKDAELLVLRHENVVLCRQDVSPVNIVGGCDGRFPPCTAD